MTYHKYFVDALDRLHNDGATACLSNWSGSPDDSRALCGMPPAGRARS
jgi:hypothetical protein